jgi:hypothetical protein
LVERIVLHQASDGGCGFEIELIGDVVAMVGLGSAHKDSRRRNVTDPDVFQSSMKVVAGGGATTYVELGFLCWLGSDVGR